MLNHIRSTLAAEFGGELLVLPINWSEKPVVQSDTRNVI
jgi:hypothetical protein